MFESLVDDEVAIRVDLIATFVAFRINLTVLWLF